MSKEEIKEKIKAYYLGEDIGEVLDFITNLQVQLQQKENIIKEVREYIEEHLEREYFDYDILEANTIYNRDLHKVLKILDKESEVI